MKTTIEIERKKNPESFFCFNLKQKEVSRHTINKKKGNIMLFLNLAWIWTVSIF